MDEGSSTLAEISRMSRSLAAAVHASREPDPLDDEAVSGILSDVRMRNCPVKVARMLGAMVLFAQDRLNASRAAIGLPPASLADMEFTMVADGGLDPELLRDCFDAVAGMREGVASEILTGRLGHVVATWGPYGLVTEVFVFLRIARTIAAAEVGWTTESLLQGWAMNAELLLTHEREHG